MGPRPRPRPRPRTRTPTAISPSSSSRRPRTSKKHLTPRPYNKPQKQKSSYNGNNGSSGYGKK